MVNSVGIVTGRPKDRGCIPGRGKASRPALEPSQPSRDTGSCFYTVKASGTWGSLLTSYSAKLRTSGAKLVLAVIYGVHKNNFGLKYFYGSTTLVGQDLFIAEVSGLHCDTLHSVGPLWTGDRPVTETST